jgi:putative hemolysin
LDAYVVYSLIFLVLLLLSAIFSGSETAFFSLSESDKEKLNHLTIAQKERALYLLDQPQHLLTTIIIGNTFVNIAIASLAAFLTHDYAMQHQLPAHIVTIIDVVVVTFVILLVSEILPKVIAVRKNIRFIGVFSLFIWTSYILLYPLTWILGKVIGDFAYFLNRKYHKPILDDTEIKTFMEYGEERGDLDKEEKEMLNSIFEFGQTTVKEIMIPRTDMSAFDLQNDLSQLFTLVEQKHFSRIPVYDGKIDSITGILYVKDMLPFLLKDKVQNLELRKILRPPYFIPEQKNIDDLLREFQEEKIHIAIVVDEYGGTAGLVTLEDVIEEIVGEIHDEFDDENLLVRKLGDNEWLVSGKTPIYDFKEELQVYFEEQEDVETIGGLLLAVSGNIPKEGEEIHFADLRFRVLKVTRQRIMDVRVSRLPKAIQGN